MKVGNMTLPFVPIAIALTCYLLDLDLLVTSCVCVCTVSEVYYTCTERSLLHVYMYALLHVQRTPEHSPRAPRQRVMQAASWSGGRMHTVSARTRSVALVYRQFALASTACSQPTLLQLPAWAWARH